MSQNELVVSPMPNFTANINVSLEDVVTVAVSHAEELLNGKFKSLMDEVEALQKVFNKNTLVIKKFVDEFRYNEDAAKAIQKTLSDCGVKHTKVNFTCNVYCEKLQVGFNVVCEKKDTCNCNVNFSALIKLPGELAEMFKDEAAIQAEITALQKEALKIKKQLGSMPSIERMAKRRVIEQRLSTTEDGAAMLQSMLGTLQGDIQKLLPQ